MAALFDSGIFSVEGLAGEILPGAKLYFYAAGTSTPLATYIDKALTTPNANPVVAGADGRFGPIWLQSALYKIVLKTALDVTLVTRDNVGPGITSTVPSIGALAAASFAADAALFVTEPGRAGTFVWRDGDYSAAASSDPLQGIYVKSDAVATSAGCWVRDWDGIHGHPEWFGAAGDGATDDLAALTACYTLCPVTLLAAKDYQISDTLVLRKECRTLRGTSRFNLSSGSGSRIVMASASADIVRIGYDTQPSGAPEQDAAGAGFLKENTLERFAIHRSVAPDPPADMTVRETAGAGLRMKYVLKCNVRDLLVTDSCLGVYVGAAIYTKVDDVEARLDGNTSAGNQQGSTSWYLDGKIGFGYAGGNASLYITRCVGVAGRRNTTTGSGDPIGLLARGAYVDTFIDNFEVARSSKGMVFDSQGYNNPFQTADLWVNHPVIDQVDSYGIEIVAPGSEAGIEIRDPYITGDSAGEAQYAINAVGGGGMDISGGQILGGFASGAALAIIAMGNAKVSGLKIYECAAPVAVDNCEALDIDVQCINQSQTATQAFNITNTKRSIFRPQLTGGASKITYGINIDTGSANCTLDVTRIPDNLTTDRIRRNGAGVTGQGNISTHLVINPGETITV